MSELLNQLNPSQKEAVTTIQGPVLIIAGAGSGKTRALAYRVVYLIKEKNIQPTNILAVTFTNKSAQEMKERIASLLDNSTSASEVRLDEFGIDYGENTQNSFQTLPLIGTFHSICVKILRQEVKKLGYQSSFNIFDDQDQLVLIKRVIKELQINPEQFKPKTMLGAISKAKNELTNTETFTSQANGYWEEMIAKIYLLYQKNLQKQNALDFDDLLMLTVKLFQTFPEVLKKYQNLFHYIMVDEYQDTNYAQYLLIKLLGAQHQNICVVGDDWQGIYSWRGANIQNILDFEKDYPQAKIIKLEQNYRSTQNILDAAYGVISKNVNRKDKKIWTDNKGGELIDVFEARDEKEEANFIVKEILSLKKQKKVSLADFVILYRTNAQSRIIEEAMLKYSLPYRIIGGVKFYQRKEIKDILAYLRLVQNPQDEISLERAINCPKRGIGKISFQKWLIFAQEKKLNLIQSGLKINTDSQLHTKKIATIKKFAEFINSAQEKIVQTTLVNFIEFIITKSGFEKYLLDGAEEGEMRLENVRELLTVARKYNEYTGPQGLTLLLEEVALISDVDNVDQASEAVHMMTLHSAKGLEFKNIFIAGLEEGILPHSRSMLSPTEMEEERRLMYVGITRAKEKVYLVFAKERNIFGSTQINASSRFLEDIPKKLLSFCNPPTKKPVFYPASNKNNSYSTQTINFKDGDRVHHQDFGDGLIVASQGDIITVAFSQVGLKKLSASIAPLKKI